MAKGNKGSTAGAEASTSENKRDFTIREYEAMLDAALKIGLPALSMDTSARLAAIVAHISSEEFVYCPKMLAEIRYMQRRFHVDGGETPDADFADLLRQYYNEIDAIYTATKKYPQWIYDFCKARYNIKLPI